MDFRKALQPYIDSPDKHDDNTVVYYDTLVVIIKDKFPKSLFHYLILPRDPQVTHQHPLAVFQDNQQLYDDVAMYISQAKRMIVDNLISRKLVDFEKDDKVKYNTFINTFIKAGVHSIPSLNNLHIHVITQDFYLEKMKHKKHYNSFTTTFFVEFDRLKPPRNHRKRMQRGFLGYQSGEESNDSHNDESSDLESDSSIEKSDVGLPQIKIERDPKTLESLIKTSPLLCTYCGKNFGNRFKELKLHLEREYFLKFKPSDL